MDKRQAQGIIRETFEAPFDKGRFAGFVKNLLNRIEDAPFTYQGNYIPAAYTQYIRTLERIGKFSDRENSVDILVITLLRETSLERARTMQRNFVAWYLNGSRGGEMKDAALVAYVSPDKEDWRFSLVKMEYKFEKTATGRTKVKEEFTPARRWSFLVGSNEKSHTAQSRLVNILLDDENAPTLAELEESFNIETVTREFFLKYRELFIRTKEALDKLVNNNPGIKADFEAKGVDTVNFAKKLLGQIVFLYFLQKKGWFGVGRDAEWGTGSKQFLRELFEKRHSDYKNFFNDVLEPLFYEALRMDRSHDDHYYSRFDCKIPFLNGGLFDPIANYDWVRTDVNLPDKLFSNTNKTKEGDTGDGILDVFDRYNFTVKEDEPLEKEVAIDPELLGKAYEKFNAIRPDNFDDYKKALKSGKKGDETKFNKQFGVYYTPREIVHYMCRESLINYLYAELNPDPTYRHSGSVSEHGVDSGRNPEPIYRHSGEGHNPDPTYRHSGEGRNPEVSREDIEALIHLGEHVSENEARVLSKGRETRTYSHQLPESIRKNAKLIDDKLADITVCDPAVGSGAFPVGMMSEIVKTRTVLSTFINPPSSSTSPIEKGGTEGGSRTTYDFKRRCIEHSLYGVDIDPGAVEIAKLRLWLSLVVDEDDIKNIKPLPNLDYKIMQGNSLIELLSTESLVSTQDYKRTELVQQLKKAKDELFNITAPAQKEKKRHEIDMSMKRFFEYDREKQIERLQMKIREIKSQQRLFEDEKVKKGKERKIREIENNIEELKNINSAGPKEHFEWHINYSEIFQEKVGFDVVIANPPYIFARESKKKGLTDTDKKYFYENYKLAEYQVNLYPLFIEKGTRLLRAEGCFCFITPKNWLTINTNKKLRKFVLEQSDITIVNFYSRVFESAAVDNAIIIFRKSTNCQCVALYEYTNGLDFLKKVECDFFLGQRDYVINIEAFKGDGVSELIQKLESQSVPLSTIASVKAGLKAYETGTGVPPQTEAMKKNRVYHSKHKIDATYLKYLDGHDVCRYLIKWSGEYLKYGDNLAAPRKDFSLFSTKRILVRQIPANPPFCIHACLIEYTVLNDLNSINIINIQESPEFVLGILNSRLTSFWFIYKFGKMQRATFPQFKVNELADFPLPKNRESRIEDIGNLVKKILVVKKNDPEADTTVWEKEIDQMVYQLYGLTMEEIKIVEGIK